MTTATAHRPVTGNQTADPRNDIDPAASRPERPFFHWVKDHAFQLVLLGAGLAAGIALYWIGGSVNAPVFVNFVIQWVVSLYNLAIMAYPVFLLVRYCIMRELLWGVQLAVRGTIIVFSFVYTIFFLTMVLRMMGAAGPESYAGNSWQTFVAVGWILAIGLHGLAAYLLAWFPTSDPKVKKAAAALPGRRQTLADAEAALTVAQNEQAARQTVFDDRQQKLDDATSAKDKAAKKLKEAQERYSENKKVKHQKELTDRLAEVARRQQELTTQIGIKADEISRETEDVIKSTLTGQRLELLRELDTLNQEQTTIDRELGSLKRELESPGGATTELKSYETASEAATEAFEKVRTKFETAEKRLEKAGQAVEAKGKLVKKAQTKVNADETIVKKAKTSAKMLWRGAILQPGIGGLFLLAAFIWFYASFYGWKLVEFSITV